MMAKLVAPCGMNCAVCTGFLRKKKPCPGCSSLNGEHNRKCSIRSCKNLKGRYCYSCETFPCRRLKQLDTRYKKNYGTSLLENLGTIRSQGVRRFLKSEEERWTCPVCGGTISIHDRTCRSCGMKKPAP
jgi:hypothetical protein